MTSQDEQVFPYYRSPDAIRDQVFAHRMRGLDEEEVYEFLDLLADQVQATEIERVGMRTDVQRLRAENEVLRNENQRIRSEQLDRPQVQPVPAPPPADTEALFSQAQRVADQVVEEAVRHARDLLAAARVEQREILQRARHEAASLRPPAGWAQPAGSGLGADYARANRVAQAQLRTLVQAMAEQVERLSEPPAELPPGSVTISGDDQLPVKRTSSWPYEGRYP